MGTTADKLNKIIATKSDIKNAIIEKGVDVSDSDVFSSYGDKIRNIKSGSTLPSPFIDRIDLYKKLKAQGITLEWDDSIFGYDYRDGHYTNGYGERYYFDVNTKLNTLISNSKSNISVFLDRICSYGDFLNYLARESIVQKNGNYRTTNDISGELGYYDLNNARYVNFSSCFEMDSSNNRKIFGFGDFATIKFPKIYAPKCAWLYISSSDYDYTDGIFYTPGGNPYEIVPDATEFYYEDIYQGYIYPRGKQLYYTLSLTNTVDVDMLVESFPINSTGDPGRLQYYTSRSAPKLTSAQKNKLAEKGWSVHVD